jgi:Na+/H+ antiporter NhaD/arsenite permease-like protein
MNSTLLAAGVFLITYALIVTERVNRTVAALLGGVVMILLGVVTQEQAFDAIDWNVIFLLAGMMIIANLLRERYDDHRQPVARNRSLPMDCGSGCAVREG